MNTIQLPAKLFNTLILFEGERIEDKIEKLMLKNTEYKIHNLNEELSKYESRYGMNFRQFSRAWKEGRIADKHSHNVEVDYIEWEAIEMEKSDSLKNLRKLFNK